ncbi:MULTISPECIES: phosphatase PAP2 family protein [Dyadobacter]|jgi:membrane-associated phospholipid phosphatase|uniref:Phosphatase PAP2 family protein n=2 Tax=Dyadobacter TaxID=120831 RepID=A0A4R5DHF9_9BACT|nr:MULTISPECIES: phosphatase PAP2 family protein [Dyadobacter]TDE13279.1 phosphatase PAP2 family protein [Dyadobacter psychrotolerans]SKC19680.1 Membrane-associated phospholipid phosphatase [Dyadobacter psychrophilus]
MKKSLFVLFLLSLMLLKTAYAQNADINLLKFVNLHRNTGTDGFFRGITNSAAPVSLGIPIAMLGLGLLKKDSLLKRNAIYIGVSVISASVVTDALKYLVHRDRPFVTYAFIQKATQGGSPSFPSGHTTDAFALATSVSLICPKWYVIAPAYLWASSVAYSRVDLGVHYPTDVLAGAIIGAGTSYLCYKINQRLAARRK